MFVFSPTVSNDFRVFTHRSGYTEPVDNSTTGTKMLSCFHPPNFVLLHTDLRVITHQRADKNLFFLFYIN